MNRPIGQLSARIYVLLNRMQPITRPAAQPLMGKMPAEGGKPFLADVMSHPENSPSGASGIFPAKAPRGAAKVFSVLSGGQSGADS